MFLNPSEMRSLLAVAESLTARGETPRCTESGEAPA